MSDIGPVPVNGPAPVPSLPEFDEEATRPLSPVRVLIALLLVAAVVAAGLAGVRSRLDTATAPHSPTWFGPYVDVTATPTYPFQVASSNPAAQTVLGFVVADPTAPCTPSWGGVATLAQADQALALNSRIAQLAEEGAQAVVSFGGRDHTDLADACTDPGQLAAAYESVVDTYRIHAIDLDIEGSALGNPAANQRRAEAIRTLQQTERTHHQSLAVWVTLPVETDGLQDNALATLNSLLAARVDVAGVNILAMDFSNAPPDGNQLTQVESAAQAAHGQLVTQFGRYGIPVTSVRSWQQLGVTVMIGQNDQADQRFTTGDAHGLVAFANRVRLGRVSMWSLNRDSQCGSSFARVGVLSNTCSGVPQTPLEFSTTLSGLTGTLADAPASLQAPAPDTNPADAPFPLWSATTPYQAGTKVVRNGYIYEAKWYNSGQDPSAQVGATWQTPWEILGPVLPADGGTGATVPVPPVSTSSTTPPSSTTTTAAAIPTTGTAAWSATVLYLPGDRVVENGTTYQARWANEGAPPAGAAADPSSWPWSVVAGAAPG